MSIYGGYDPGTFQAWALNLFTDIFVSPGIARGFSVVQTTSPSMAVQVTLSGGSGDGVLYLSNGCWMRIDAPQTLSIGANNSGSTRTDAVVATVDPSGSPSPSLTIQANWPNGFAAPASNQFVVALISVANGAVSILNANITMNSAVAGLTGAGGGSSMTASDGVGLQVQDNSASSTLSVVLTGLTTGIGRGINIQTTDKSAIGHQFIFDTVGNFYAPAQVNANTYGGPISIDVEGPNTVVRAQPTSNNIVLQAYGYNWTFQNNGGYSGPYGQIPQMGSVGGGSAGGRIWEGTSDPGSNAAEGDFWIAG